MLDFSAGTPKRFRAFSPMSPTTRRPFQLLHRLALLGGVMLLPGAAPAQSSEASMSSPGTTQGTMPGAGPRPVPRDYINPSLVTKPVAERPKLMPVYFPSPPPVLDAELPPLPVIRDKLWSDLMPHSNELFFAPLSTRLSENDLNRRHRQRLDAHLTSRKTALAELQTALEAAYPDAAARQAALEALAQRQEPTLAALTTSADLLRHDLYRGGLLLASADWNLYRNWRLGEEDSKRTPQELLYDEFSVLRAAIYYQEGLSAEQRHLLREVTIELAEALGDREPTALGDSFEPEQVLFFLPHGVRLRLPGGLPAELSAEIAAFTAAKSALKRELREALFRLDRESSGKREDALRDLAARQAPAFAQLEQMARKLRPALATLPTFAQAATQPGLPAALAARIDAYLREKADLQRAARRETEDPAPDAGARKNRATSTREALAQFEEKNRARFTALAAEARAIREEVARHAAAQGGGHPVKSVDALLADFARAFQHQQLQSLYRHYRAAVFEPGLSPAQRQLLFDTALAGLDLIGVKDWQAVPE